MLLALEAVRYQAKACGNLHLGGINGVPAEGVLASVFRFAISGR
jgi:hypothetical protein